MRGGVGDQGQENGTMHVVIEVRVWLITKQCGGCWAHTRKAVSKSELFKVSKVKPIKHQYKIFSAWISSLDHFLLLTLVLSYFPLACFPSAKY